MASSVIDRINDKTMAQVIPGFPNEIALMILRELPLADLVILYTINNDLRATLDGDEPLRKKMFRIPKKYDVDETTKVAWVRDQCQDATQRDVSRSFLGARPSQPTTFVLRQKTLRS